MKLNKKNKYKQKIQKNCNNNLVTHHKMYKNNLMINNIKKLKF